VTEAIAAPLSQTTVDTFFAVDIRLGRITSAERLEGARKPAYKLEIDFGPSIGIKRSSAQLVELYTRDDLVGRQILAVVNFPPRRIAGFESQVLTLGVPAENGAVVLLSVERDAPLGSRVF
jgi:tRNA-binding protein